MKRSQRSIGTIPIVGGHVALDLLNTSDWRSTDRPLDHLSSVDDLLLWLKRVDIIADEEIADIVERSAACPAAGRAALQQVMQLRDCLFELVGHAMGGDARFPVESAVCLQRMWRSAVRGAQIVRGPGAGIRRIYDHPLCAIAGEVAIQSVDLLTSDQARLIKICERAGCGWFFLDHSRKRSRRWCSMQDCGNVMKQSRYRRRCVDLRSSP